MDILNDNPKKLFFKYLTAAFGSSLIMSVYSLVDTIVIGHYVGPDGTAAVAAFMPMWTIMFAFGLLFGIGGSVLMAQQRGAGNKKYGDTFYTMSIIGGVIISLIIFAVYNLCPEQLIYLFGGRGDVLALALQYEKWIAICSPLFVMGQILIPFIRNDGHPGYTTVAVMAGGIFNVFGDLFFVYGCNMGILGAGLATALGQLISFVILLVYLFRKKCNLKFVPLKWNESFAHTRKIVKMGGSNFIIDIAVGILAIMFNNQIVTYMGSSALAVYGVISSVATIMQTLGYAIGESAQAILSANFGAGKKKRVLTVFRYGIIVSFIVGIIGFLIFEAMPELIVKIYMNATAEVSLMAPAIMRTYAFAFLLLVFNVFCTYYFQSVARPGISMSISLLRGILINGLLIYLLPVLFGAEAIWLAIPISETVVGLYTICMIMKTIKNKS